MANGLEQEKEALRQELRDMIAQGVPQADIVAHRDAKLAEIEGKQAAAQQQDAIVQQSADGASDSDPSSSESAYTDVGGFDKAAEPEYKKDPELGAWDNFKNNVQNVWTRILGFDDRLTLATQDTFEYLLGKENAEKLNELMPYYDQETGEWLDSSEEIRANAYKELAELDSQIKQTYGLQDAWKDGNAFDLISAAGGAGLNILSTMVTSGLTGGAGIYTDMIADAIVDANTAKADRLGISVQELYESGEAEFEVPATIGIAGGLLERMGIKGVRNYIAGVSPGIGKAAIALLNNSGREGLTEWTQFGLETYNRQKAEGNEDAAGTALESMLSREGVEAALQGAVGAFVAGGTGRAGRKALGIKNDQSVEAGDSDLVALVNTVRGKEVDNTHLEGNWLFETGKKVGSKGKYQPTVPRNPDGSVITQEQEEQEEIEKEEARLSGPEFYDEYLKRKRSEKAQQTRANNQVIKEINDEYEGTAETLNNQDRLAYVGRGVEQQLGATTLDQALGMMKTPKKEALALVTKAGIGMRSQEDLAKLNQLNVNLFEAQRQLELAKDPTQSKALESFISDTKTQIADIFNTQNKKILLASPSSVFDAVEAANELSRLTAEEKTIAESKEIDDDVKSPILDNIQDRKNRAYEKGELAKQAIEKSYQENVQETNTQAAQYEELLNEEVADNEQKVRDILLSGADLGLLQDPDAPKVTGQELSESRQALVSEDDGKEYGIRMGGILPTRTDAVTAGTKIAQEIKSKGLKADIEYVDVNPERAGGETQINVEVYSPLQESRTETLNKQEQAELEQEAPVVDETQQELDQAAEVAEPVTETERGPLDYAQDVAAKNRSEVEEVSPGEFFTTDRKTAYNLAGGLRKRGHSKAFVDDRGDEGITVFAGERDAEPRADYQVEEAPANNEGVEFNLEEGPKNFRRHLNLADVAGNRIQLNIGLENNPYTYQGIIAKLAKNPKVRLGTTEQVDGEYNGNPERTLVVNAKYDGPAKEFRSFIEGLNKDMTQEAIGAKFNGKGALIYDPDFTGERYTFDPQYFLAPSKQADVTEDIEAARKQQIPESIPGGRKPAGISPRELGQEAGERARVIQAIKEGPESKLEPGVKLAKEVKEPAPQGEEFDAEPAFDRREVGEGPTLDEELRGQTRIDEDFIDDYNNNNKSNNDLIKAMTPYILGKQRDPDLQGVALEKFAQQVDAGKLKGKSIAQVFGAARRIAEGAPTLRNVEYGQSRDYQRHRNVVRRAEQAFFAEEGYNPSNTEIADYINNNKNKYNINITPEQVEDAKFDEVASGVELAGVQGTARDRAQTRIAKEAGFDQLTDEIVGPQIKDRIDSAVERILNQRPIYRSAAKYRDLALRRGATFAEAVKGDKDAANLKKANTLIDQDIRSGLNDYVSAANLREAFPTLRELFGLDQNSFDDLSRSQKQDLKRKVVKGLAQEAEQRLGKTQTPSQELDFDIEAGDATRTTDLGRKSKIQVNSHRQPWSKTANEINNSIRNTDFDKDWVQWSPGRLGDIERGRAKGIPDHVIRELNRQPARVAKIAAKNGLDLRKDTRNPGVYHIYKPGKPGSKPSFQLTEDQAKTRATQEFIDSVTPQLQKAWPGYRIETSPREWSNKIEELRLQGVSMPWSKVKGFVVGNGIYLSPTKVGYDTPIHEFAHVWERQLQRENPKLWKRGVELLKGSEYARAVYNIPKYKSYLKDNPTKFWGEVMSNAIGKRGAVLFDSKQKQGAWDKWMNSVGNWIKNKLGILSDKDYADLTLNDWLDTAVHGVFTGTTPVAPAAKTEYNLEEDPTAEPDVAAAYLRGKQARGKWYDPKSWVGRLIPPAADDYHGLVSKLKNISGIDRVTKTYQKNHKQHIDKVTRTRKKIKDITNKLGIPLDKKDVVTLNGNKLTAAQAIQAHVDGFENDFSRQPEVQSYIKAMTDLGVLKPSKDKRYDLASPAQDIYNYLNNDMYQEAFQEFNKAKEEVFTPEVMESIVAEHGDKYAEALQGALQRMSSGKNSRGFTDKTTQKWNDWALGSVGTIMFLNFRSAALQMMSVGNFGFESKNPGKFVAGFFSPDTYKLARKLYNDPYLKERRARAGFDVNAAEMMDLINNSKTFGDFTKKVLNKGFIATSFVDSMAIAMGGAAFMKAGGTRAQWIEATEEAQQSARPDRVSQWQTEGISKFVLAFANTPQQYFRLSQKAYRAIREGKDVKRNLAKIGYYMVAQNMLFTAAQAASTALLGGEDDEEKVKDGLNSMSSTILRGMGLYGAAIDAAKNVIVQAIKEEGKANPDHVNSVLKATSISPPLNRKIQDLLSIGRAHKYDADDKYLTTATRATAFATNLPADWVQKKYDATMALWDDQYTAWQKALMLAGWSKWNFKDSEGDNLDDFDLDLDDLDLDLGDLDL